MWQYRQKLQHLKFLGFRNRHNAPEKRRAKREPHRTIYLHELCQVCPTEKSRLAWEACDCVLGPGVRLQPFRQLLVSLFAFLDRRCSPGLAGASASVKLRA